MGPEYCLYNSGVANVNCWTFGGVLSNEAVLDEPWLCSFSRWSIILVGDLYIILIFFFYIHNFFFLLIEDFFLLISEENLQPLK